MATCYPMIYLDASSHVHGSPWSKKSHRLFLEKVSVLIPHKIHLTINMVDAPTIQDINKKYRQKDYPTNILSFTYETSETLITGELVICPSVLREEALALALSLDQHYAHLLIHGILHILGYDHETDEDAHIMEALETQWLLALGYNAPYLSSQA